MRFLYTINEMGLQFIRKILPVAAMLLLAAGVIFLIIMQINWAGQAVIAHKEELKRTLMLNIATAMEKTGDETGVIFSLLTISPEDYAAGNWEPFSKDLEFLASNTCFFDLAGEIYLLPVPEGENVLLYSREKALFLPALLPEMLQDYPARLQQDQLREFIRKANLNYFFISPVQKIILSGQDRRLYQPDNLAALLAVEINTLAFYAKHLAGTLEDLLHQYSFRIRQANKEYYASVELTKQPRRKPDFRIPLVFPQLHLIFNPPPVNPENQLPAEADSLPFIRYLDMRDYLQRHRNPPEPGQFFIEKAAGNPELEIFYPAGPFEVIAARQTRLNLIVSITVVAALVTGLLLLYRLYTRIRELREKEQEFVATISHELRTPLAVIESTSDNLYHGIVSPDEKIRKYGQVIRDQVKRLTLMIENILQYAGLEGGRNSKKRPDCEFSLDPFMEKLINSLQELADKKQMRLSYARGSFRGKIKTDPIALGLIINNLLVNALQHSKAAGREQQDVRLLLKRNLPRGISIIIEDDGPGIPIREQKKIFQPFFRGEDSIKQQLPGSGLGLHLVKRITELLGGNVKLSSPYLCFSGHQKQGCRFTIHFPFEVIDEEHSKDSAD